MNNNKFSLSSFHFANLFTQVYYPISYRLFEQFEMDSISDSRTLEKKS